MCNCGRKRTAYSQQSPSANVNTKMNIPVQTQAYATFEYIGKTALTVIGNVTGIQYRFNFPGSKLNINSRDIQGLISIPVLKRL
jgi:hypothetical protein